MQSFSANEDHLRLNLYGERTPEGSRAAQASQLPWSDSAAIEVELQNRFEPSQWTEWFSCNRSREILDSLCVLNELMAARLLPGAWAKHRDRGRGSTLHDARAAGKRGHWDMGSTRRRGAFCTMPAGWRDGDGLDYWRRWRQQWRPRPDSRGFIVD
jgi:hypothetical protein